MRRVLLALLAVLAPALAAAQDMPDPSIMHGRALPAPELPAGTVTVRVVKEALGNDLPGQRVTVTAGDTTRTATTDEQGRAEFAGLPLGSTAQAVATVEGETLESQPFPVPNTGGVRVALVAGLERAAARRAEEEAAAAAAPAARGIVVAGGNSRVLMQFSDDALQVFYVLEIVNNARTRVDVGEPLVFELPEEAVGAAPLEGSSPQVQVEGRRVAITGPFASGTTQVQLAFTLRYGRSDYTFTQTFPVALQQVAVGVEKVGDLGVASSQFAAVNDVRTEEGGVFVLGTGPALPAGTPLTVSLTSLPRHSPVPRYTALGLALALVGLGVWLAATGRAGRGPGREALIRRREALLGELAQLETKRRAGDVGAERYATRRGRLMRELEQIYGELDETHAGPRGGGEDVAA